MFQTEHELPESIKRLPFGKMGRCPMDTFSPKCPFCLAENHPFSPNRMERKVIHPIGREGNVPYPDLSIESAGFKLIGDLGLTATFHYFTYKWK